MYVLLTVVTLVPFITVTTIVMTTSTSGLKDEAQTIQKNSAELNADRIDRFMVLLKDILTWLEGVRWLVQARLL